LLPMAAHLLASGGGRRLAENADDPAKGFSTGKAFKTHVRVDGFLNGRY